MRIALCTLLPQLFLIGINFGKVFPELFDYYSKNQDQLEGLYERFSRGNDFTPWLLITESQHNVSVICGLYHDMMISDQCCKKKKKKWQRL